MPAAAASSSLLPARSTNSSSSSAVMDGVATGSSVGWRCNGQQRWMAFNRQPQQVWPQHMSNIQTAAD